MKLTLSVLLVVLASGCEAADQAEPSSLASEPGVALGGELTGASEVPLADLVAAPQEFEGKVVTLSGTVAAMCHHRRDWFAIVPDGETKTYVRVLAGRAFRVPEDAIGKSARTEGAVELLQLSERVARHFSKEHRLGQADTIDGPVQQVVLRATAAEFY